MMEFLQTRVNNESIFLCETTDTAKLRKELGWKKSDMKDAELVRELFRRDPSIFIEFNELGQLEFVRTYLTLQYETVTKDCAALKNRRHAFKREFGHSEAIVYDELISRFEKEKVALLKNITPMIKEELGLVQHIKGVGSTLTARILANAPPHLFPSRWQYLTYCGYTNKSRHTNKYNRAAKTVFYLMAEGALKASDPVYRPLYDKFKTYQFEKACADCWLTKKGHKCKNRKAEDQTVCNGRAHRVALNRVSTAIAEEFWEQLHDIEPRVDVRSWFK